MHTHPNESNGTEDEYFNIEHIDPVDGVQRNQNDIKEVKSKRLNLLLKPTIYREFKKIAVMKQVSVNHLINELLKDAVQNEAKLIGKYNDTFHID